MNRFLFIFLCLILSFNSYSGDPKGFILAGSVGKDSRTSSNHGTWCDEWAVIGMAAKKKVTHGGYFCPYQFQCENRNGEYHSWIRYIYPSGYYGCFWLCEDGYYGDECSNNSSTPSSCDSQDFTNHKTKYSILQTGEDSGMLSNDDIWRIDGAWTDTWVEESYVHYGITEYKKHGVIAENVRVYCEFTRYGEFCNKDNYESWVNEINTLGTDKKLLCAKGYKANSSGDDCEPINSNICEFSNVSLCDGFNKEKFDKTNHKFEENGNCSVIMCKDSTKSLTSESDYTCVECINNKRKGIDKNTGLCIECSLGEVFNRGSNKCVQAKKYTKLDLLYGKDKDKNSEPDLKKQCWTMNNPDNYQNCVVGSDISSKPFNSETQTSVSQTSSTVEKSTSGNNLNSSIYSSDLKKIKNTPNYSPSFSSGYHDEVDYDPEFGYRKNNNSDRDLPLKKQYLQEATFY